MRGERKVSGTAEGGGEEGGGGESEGEKKGGKGNPLAKFPSVVDDSSHDRWITRWGIRRLSKSSCRYP